MRTIKFRGKTVDTGEWIIGDLIHKGDGIFIKPITDADSAAVPVDDDTVGEYTGIVDSNGVEIFEGDYVATPNGKPWHWRIDFKRGVFVFVRSNARSPFEGFKYYSDFMLCETLTVIGNVFDSADLRQEELEALKALQDFDVKASLKRTQSRAQRIRQNG